VVHLQVSLLGGSCDETWCRLGMRKRSVSWNVPKLSQLWWCNGGFGPCTTENHLRTTQFVGGTWKSSRVTAYAVKWTGHRPRLPSVCEKHFSGAPYVTKAGHQWGRTEIWSVSLLTCSPLAWPSQLLYRRGQKSRTDLRITLYMYVCIVLRRGGLTVSVIGIDLWLPQFL
jgi:hypothetical protein